MHFVTQITIILYNNFVVMKISQKDIYYFWVDYIEVVWTLKKLNDINFWIAFSDWNRKTIFPWFEVRRENKVTNYEYKIVFNYKWTDCYAYHIWQENWAVTTYDYLAVYGIAFVIFPELSEIIEFITAELEVMWLRRFDLALDVLSNIKEVHKNFKKLKQKWSIFFDDEWEVQTFYIWEKKKKNNRYKLLRVYNKKDDILIKHRQKFYPDYLTKENVTRIEIEIRSELAKNCSLDSLLDRSYIFDMYLTYMDKYTDIFKWFKYTETRLNQINKKVSIENLKSDQYLKSRYVNIFRWYAKTILEIWGCPVDLLLRDNLLSEDTKKDIALSIKNWIFRQDMYEFWLNVRYSKSLFADNEDDVLYFNDEKYGWE